MLENAIEFAERVPPSLFAYHDGECCRLARSWFLNTDRWLYPRNRSLPVWIHQRYQWGPSRWPIYWCEAVKAEKLDCGAQSALALEAFAERGLRALPCQIIRKFDRQTIAQWRASWGKDGCATEWGAGEHAYHEVCAILRGNRVEVWDPSGNATVRHDLNQGYGSAVALRIKGPEQQSGDLIWDSVRVSLNQWTLVDAPEDAGPAQMWPCRGASIKRRAFQHLNKLAS